MDRRETRPSLAELIDAVRWDYTPDERLLSPLTATARYFEAFPWDGEGGEEPPAPATEGERR